MSAEARDSLGDVPGDASHAIDAALRRHAELAALGLRRVGRWSARHSELIEYRGGSPEQPAAILVKRITNSTDAARARATVLREYEALQRIRTLVGAALSDTVPQPWLVLPEIPALVVTKLPGEPLDRLLRRRANRVTGIILGRHTIGAVARAGDWLRRFHDATAQPERPFDGERFIAASRTQLDRCRAIGLAPESEALVWRVVRKAIDYTAGRSERTAARHGDFLPQNVLLDRTHVALTDFENFAECDAVMVDVANMSGVLRLMAASPFYARRPLLAARARFLDAYGANLDRDQLLLHELLVSLTVMAQISPAQGRRPAARPRRLRWLVPVVHELADQIAQKPI